MYAPLSARGKCIYTEEQGARLFLSLIDMVSPSAEFEKYTANILDMIEPTSTGQFSLDVSTWMLQILTESGLFQFGGKWKSTAELDLGVYYFKGKTITYCVPAYQVVTRKTLDEALFHAGWLIQSKSDSFDPGFHHKIRTYENENTKQRLTMTRTQNMSEKRVTFIAKMGRKKKKFDVVPERTVESIVAALT